MREPSTQDTRSTSHECPFSAGHILERQLAVALYRQSRGVLTRPFLSSEKSTVIVPPTIYPRPFCLKACIAPPQAQELQELRREHGVAVLAALASRLPVRQSEPHSTMSATVAEHRNSFLAREYLLCANIAKLEKTIRYQNAQFYQ